MNPRTVMILAVLVVAAHQALAEDEIFGRPDYYSSQVVSWWGNAVWVMDPGGGELRESAYTAVAGGIHLTGQMHRSFTWTGASGPSTARFDFALCAEVALGTSYSNVNIRVTGFLRDVTTATYPIRTTLYSYWRSTPGYKMFLTGDVVNRPVEMTKGHTYTIGYSLDVFASCYPRSPCPMASANVGEQGCSFWWQPTGVFEG